MPRKQSRPNAPPVSRDDPVVAEVRRARARLLKKSGGTLKSVIRYVNEQAAARKKQNTASAQANHPPRRGKAA